MQRTLHKLKFADRLTELFAVMNILNCVVKGGLHQPKASQIRMP